MKLTQNFTLEELLVSQEAARRGINNTPPGEVVVNLTKLANMLEEVRAFLGDRPIHVSSGYRSAALNAAIGATATSHHILGGAVDFTCASYGSPLAVARAIEGSDIPFGQLIHEYGAWVHLSIMRAANPANRVITIDRQGTRQGILEARK